MIHRDVQTGIYVTLSNPQTVKNATDQRNILSLCSSKDLKIGWSTRLFYTMTLALMVADSIRYTGFHYVDWHLMGTKTKTSLWQCTAYRGAVSYHNSNRMTHKVIWKWRDIVGNDMVIRVQQITFKKSKSTYTHSELHIVIKMLFF